jgi:hypothetical protein
MSSEIITVQGTLQADGTLTLQDTPGLAPGPVEVTLRRLPPSRPVPGGWLDYLQQARADLEAAGHRFRTKEAIDADLAELRADRDDLPEQAENGGGDGRESR